MSLEREYSAIEWESANGVNSIQFGRWRRSAGRGSRSPISGRSQTLWLANVQWNHHLNGIRDLDEFGALAGPLIMAIRTKIYWRRFVGVLTRVVDKAEEIATAEIVWGSSLFHVNALQHGNQANHPITAAIAMIPCFGHLTLNVDTCTTLLWVPNLPPVKGISVLTRISNPRRLEDE